MCECMYLWVCMCVYVHVCICVWSMCGCLRTFKKSVVVKIFSFFFFLNTEILWEYVFVLIPGVGYWAPSDCPQQLIMICLHALVGE